MIEKETKIITAVITSAEILIEDHDILTFLIGVKTSEGYSTSLGCYRLDYYSEAEHKYKSYTHTSELIRSMLEVLNKNKWSELTGCYCRLEVACDGGLPVFKIGHIIDDRWFDFEEFRDKHPLYDQV